MLLSKVAVLSALGLSAALAGPVRRQDSGGEPGELTTTTVGDGSSTTTTRPADNGGSTTVTNPNPSPSPTPADDCYPCVERSYNTYTSPSGKTCSCLVTPGGTPDREPWNWEGPKCINDSQGLPNDDGKPSLCLGSGGTPNSRACLNGCNAMLTLSNANNPCNPKLYNAVKACTDCIPGGALRSNLDGKGTPPYMNSASSMETFINAMKNWCAAPSRCIELSTGGKISSGQCAAVNPPPKEDDKTTTTNPGGSRTTGGTANRSSIISTRSTTVVTVVPTTDGRSSSASLPASASASIARSTLISTTDSDGRPTLSLAVETIANPDFTANTVFGGSAPTGNGSGSGSASKRTAVDTGLLAIFITTLGLAF